MTQADLAAWLPSYRSSLKDSLNAAAADGYRAVLAATTAADFRPSEFGTTARRHLARYLRDLGLTLGGLAVPHAGLGLADPRHADERMAHFRETLVLCHDLGVQRATAAIGGLTDERTRGASLDVLRAIADASDRAGVTVALDAPAEDPLRVAAELRSLGAPLLSLALDSAAPLPDAATAGRFAGAVGLAHLRDVRRGGGRFEEVEFGTGEVDFPHFLSLLAESGCTGPLVVRRDAADAGVDALRRGRDYIRSLLDRPQRR